MLAIIDMQNDFVDPHKGIMYVKGAEKLVDSIISKIKEYEKRGEKIIYTIDCHKNIPGDDRTDDEKEWGKELYKPLKEILENHQRVDKEYYSISPEEASALKQELKEKNIKEIEVAGVETHVCVLSNAIVLLNTFPDTKILIDSNACRASDESLHLKALDIMKSLKMEVK